MQPKTGEYQHIIIDDMIPQKQHRLAKFRKLQPQFIDETHCMIYLETGIYYIFDLSTGGYVKYTGFLKINK